MSGDFHHHIVRGSFFFDLFTRSAQHAAARIRTTGIRLACDITRQQIFEVNSSISVNNKSMPNLDRAGKFHGPSIIYTFKLDILSGLSSGRPG
jgi:hypothetical protein